MASVGRQPRRDEDGLGLVEVMLSLSVMLIVLVATSYLMANVARQAATAREKVAATELAEQWLEQLSNAPISSLQGYIAKDVQLTAQPTVVGGVAYTVWGHLEWADVGVTHSLCNTGNPPQVIRATVTVKWTKNQSLGETTIINPPYGTVVPGDGFLSIQIQGSNPPNPPADAANLINVVETVMPATTLSSAASGGATSLSVAALNSAVGLNDTIVVGTGASVQTVTASAAAAVGATTISVSALPSAASVGASVHDNAWGQATYNPDQFGCVYLQEPIGTYTVTLASPGGGPTFIDWLENFTPGQAGQTVTVAGLPAFVTFHYDEAGAVTFSPSAPAPIAGGMPISVGNGSTLVMVAVPAGSATTSAQLFPFSSAYSVWYGDCALVPPKPTIEEPASPATVSVTPKGTSSVAITGLGVLTINATRASGNFTPGAVSATATITDVKAIAGPTGDGCPVADSTGGETFGLAGLSGSTNAYSSQTAILPQTYKVIVTDSAAGGGSTTVNGVVVGAGGATVPVTVP